MSTKLQQGRKTMYSLIEIWETEPNGKWLLASKRKGAVFDFIVKGYFKLKSQSGFKFSDLFSTKSCSSKNFSSGVGLDVNWDDEYAFRNFTDFAENIYNVFGASI